MTVVDSGGVLWSMVVIGGVESDGVIVVGRLL